MEKDTALLHNSHIVPKVKPEMVTLPRLYHSLEFKIELSILTCTVYTTE
jgi:hypothetical protein